MMTHVQTWDNGKRGCFRPVNDEDYSWKFTETDDGDNITDEDWEKSTVVASHFIGYYLTKNPKDKGENYTKLYTYYYKERLKKFRNKHKAEIELIGDAKKSEKYFLNEHFKEERQAFNNSEVLFEYDTSKENPLTKLFFNYLYFLRSKNPPLYFVFKKNTSPNAFQWIAYELIATMGYRRVKQYLNQVLDWSLGRVYVSCFLNGGYAPADEDMEQIKAVYGDMVKPFEVYYIYINPTDKKEMAEAICDDFVDSTDRLQFTSETAKKLVLKHVQKWPDSVDCSTQQSPFFEVVKRQLTLCLQTITEENASNHKPFRARNFEPLDDDAVSGLYDCDCHGYYAHPFFRLKDDDFDAMMLAFYKWMRYENKEFEDDLPTTEMLKSIFKNNIVILQKFLKQICGKTGCKIVDEVVALIRMNVIDEDEAKGALRKELSKLGYKTTSKQNWNDQINKKGRTESSIKETIKHYQ